MESKRKTLEFGIEAQEQPSGKAQRTDNRVARLPAGANLVEADGKSCTHEVAWPPGMDGSSMPPARKGGPTAREYPFKVDPFQQTAFDCLEAGHNVLVAAHTSAGKTVVAEYAFAMALRDKTRVVYTSPLKALSNQKYRELAEEFHDVGLMTGDVTINPSASCLVMTTEILRSMLYRGSEVVRELSLIVYDEVHYLRDKERGVVWEESIILAPRNARFVFLSATIPNSREFAEWIARTHQSPCHVVYTDYRPTPLQHYLFPSGGDSLFMVVDETSNFREDNFQKAVAMLQDTDAQAKSLASSGKGGKGQATQQDSERSDIFKIVKMIMERNYDPVIVFSFSKRECESLALGLAALDLTSGEEKALVDQVFWSALECLSQEDQKLPQVHALLPMLRRGIGVHHSGLLPILKEVVEILFQEGLLKALFATETFSTGLNMPAKTVVFTNVRKYDGGRFRWLSSGEYIQMSGRAGRRGLDDRGIVILMLDTRMEPAIARDMIKGAPDTLYSAFHLGYNMILNLMRVEGADPEHLMGKSFRQFQVERSLPALEAKVQALADQAQAAAQAMADAQAVSEYLELLSQWTQACASLRELLQEPTTILPFLQPGRLVRLFPQAPAAASSLQLLPSFQTLLDSPPGHLLHTPSELPSSPPSTSHALNAAGRDGKDGKHSKNKGREKESSRDKGKERFEKEGKGGGEGDGGDRAISAALLDMLGRGVWGTVVNFEKVGKRKDDGDGRKKKVSEFIIDVLVALPPSSSTSALATTTISNNNASTTQDASSDTLAALLSGVVHPMYASGSGAGGSGNIGGAGVERDGSVMRAARSGELCDPTTKGAMAAVVTFPLSQVDRLSSVRIHLPKDLRAQDMRKATLAVVGEALSRLRAQVGAVPLLDPQEDMKAKDKAVRKLQSRVESLEAMLASAPLARAAALAAAGGAPLLLGAGGGNGSREGGSGALPISAPSGLSSPGVRLLAAALAAGQSHASMQSATEAARREAQAAKALILKDELKSRQRVLRRLGYVDEEGVVSLKGRLAGGLMLSEGELVMCEMVFSGAFNSLNAEQLAAVCSCFVWSEKSMEGGARLREELQGPFHAVRDAAKRVASVEAECKLVPGGEAAASTSAALAAAASGSGGAGAVDAYVEKFRPELMEPVAAWARGATFADVLKMSKVFEGSLVRAVRRLEELLRQLSEALQGVGETSLADRFEEARASIKRDIIFAASLYL